MKLLLICLLAYSVTIGQSKSINLSYSYNRKDIDSLQIMVNTQTKTIYNNSHKLHTDIDSVAIIYKQPLDSITIILRGYKKDLWCIPFIDTIRPPFRMSYGLNFNCIKLIS